MKAWVATGLAGLALSGCFPFAPTVSFVGKTCDGSSACPDGLSCVSGTCQLADGGAASSTSSGSSSPGSPSSGASSGATSVATSAGSTGGGSSTSSKGSGGTTTAGSTGGHSTGGTTTGTGGGSSGAGCGGVGEACCGGVSCSAGLACASGTCSCTVASCAPGCCDLQGCEVGSGHDACGGAGGACETCTAFQTCEAGSCAACGTEGEPCCPNDVCNSGLACAGTTCRCTPTSCPDGCCDANGCELAESQLVCGAAGVPCQNCNAGQVCQSGCVGCGGAGGPCCLDDGGLPTVCGSGLACNGSTCACTPSSCPAGCCNAQGCQAESTATCGDGGGTCSDCGNGATCEANGVCCGAPGQPCCPDSTCMPGVACLATASGCSTGTSCVQVIPTFYEQGGIEPTGIAINGSVTSGVTAADVFWAVPTNPGTVDVSATANPAVFTESGTYHAPEAVAIADNLTTLYWIDDNSIFNCTINGGQCTANPAIVTDTANDPIRSMVIDPPSLNVYWAGGLPTNETIFGCALPLCSSTQLFATSTTLQVVALAADTTRLYWADNGAGAIEIANASTRALVGSVASPGLIGGLAIDSSHVYFGALQDLEIGPIGGGSPSTLVSGPPGGCINAIAVDSDSVYWADACLGNIYKAPLCGTPVQTLWNKNSTFGATNQMSLALDATNVYWSDPAAGNVMSLAK